MPVMNDEAIRTMQKLSRDCACRAAVERAYRELRALNHTDVSAYNAAAQVYRWHHPEVTRLQARFDIADMLNRTD